MPEYGLSIQCVNALIASGIDVESRGSRLRWAAILPVIERWGLVAHAMNIGVIDLLVMGGGVAAFLAPLLIGYFGFGNPNQDHPLLKKALIGIAGLQSAVLIYFARGFGADKPHCVTGKKEKYDSEAEAPNPAIHTDAAR